MDPTVPSIVPAGPAARHRALLLGVAGDSASGKSTLSRGVQYVLGVARVARVSTDDYHRYDRSERAQRAITPLVPEANRMDLLAADVRTLAAGAAITKPTYDHLTGTFGPQDVVEPREIVIVEGLLPLADRGVRDQIDVAVFLEPEDVLRHRWKLERDVFERGYRPQEVVEELKRREPDAARYIRPQRDHADIIVRFHRQAGADDARLSARLVVRPTLPYAALRELLGGYRAQGVEPVRWSADTDRRGPVSVLEIDGDCPPSIGGELEEALWSSLHPDERLQRDRIGVIRRPGSDPERSESLALAQLLIVTHLVGSVDDAFEL